MLLWEDVPEYGRDVLWGELHTYTAFSSPQKEVGRHAIVRSYLKQRPIVSRNRGDCRVSRVPVPVELSRSVLLCYNTGTADPIVLLTNPLAVQVQVEQKGAQEQLQERSVVHSGR